MDKKRKWLKPMRKGKSKKRAKDAGANGHGGKTGLATVVFFFTGATVSA